MTQQAAKAQTLFHRGAGLHGAGRLGPAVAAYRATVLLAPDHVAALNNLAAALDSLGRHPEAAAAWERLARLQPGDPATAAGLGASLLAAGRPAEALPPLAAAASRNPTDPRLPRLLARVLLALGLRGPAIGALYAALDLCPDDAGLLNELATALLGHGQAAQALPHAQSAAHLHPSAPHAANLSCILIDLGRHREALAAADAGLRLGPDCVEALVNRSIALEALGHLDAAEAAARDALAAAPGNPVVRHHLAATLLAAGHLTPEAWALYEARLRLNGVRALPDGLRWDGGPLRGRTLLLHAEQGLGDTLQFIRYVPQAAAQATATGGGRVLLVVQPALVRLLQGTPGADSVVAAGGELPRFDVVLPLLSLPGVCGTTAGSIPPPLTCAPRGLRAPGPLRVGLAWAGGAAFVDDRHRSVPPAALAALDGLPGVQFFGLQLGADSMPPGLSVQDLMAEVQDFADTAERMAGLDLVIAADTAVAHLAASLGLPVWLLSRHRGCWRWGHGRTDSPWYPTLRIHRQPQPGDWDTVLQGVRAALACLAETGDAVER